MKAKITFILSANDPEKIDELMSIKRAVESGEFQRDLKKTGMGVTATFEYLEK